MVLLVLVIATLIGATVFLTPRGLSGLANAFLTCLCLLPLTVCLFPVYLGMVSVVYGMSRVNGTVFKQLDRGRLLTENLAAKTDEVSQQVSRQSVELGVKAAQLDAIFDVFDRYREGQKGGSSDETNRTGNGS